MTISGFTAYVKQLWKNKPDTSTPLSADRLLHIEDGIKGNSDAIAKIAAAVVNQITNDPDKIASMAALYAVNQSVTKLNSDLAGKFSLTEASLYLKRDGRIGAAQVLKNSDASNDYGTNITDYSNVYNTTFVIHNGAAKLIRTDTSGNTEIYDVAVDQNKYQIIDMKGADAVAIPPGRWCANNTLVNGELGPWYVETVEFDQKYRTVTAYPYSGEKRYYYFAKMNNGTWQGWEKYTSVI